MKTMGLLLTVFSAAIALPAWSAQRCSVHPPRGASVAQLKTLARVSQADAARSALASVKGKGAATVAGAELEAEDGCLLWSFDLQLAGKAGIEEVHVDAGDGKVLSVAHEGPRQEAAEAKQEAAAKKH